MRAKRWIGLCAIAAIVAGFSALVSAQTTSKVYQVTITLKGVRENDTPPPYSLKFTLTNDNLVNLALGNALGAPVPTNEVLALAGHHEGGPYLVVFDTASGSVRAEIGLSAGPVNGGVQTSATKRQFALLYTIENVGSLERGSLMWIGTQTLARDGSITGASGTMSGWLDITVTDGGTGGTEEQSVVIPTGTAISTLKQIGTLIEP
jgi:hypothetical protein